MPAHTSARSIYSLVGSFSLMVLALILPARAVQTAKPTEGQKLFVNRCAGCHGANGQGGSADPAPMTGTLTTSELAAFIKRSMPPGPKKCPSPDADKIAAYIHDAFYSPVAQARIRPPRIELARLTVKQFKNAVADLVGNYHSAMPGTKSHGLHGEYFKGRSRDQKNRAFDRIDPQVQFDFGTDAPAPKDIDANNFSIAWSGSVLAPDTGEYEFTIHSRHSTSLWINGSRYPTVDGEVRSAKDIDPHGSITLLGGRAYSVYMVFTKATQGVDDSNKKKAPTPSYVTLRWRRPKHAEEPIPTQYLFPEGMPKTFVVTSPFPPDDRSTGYERGDEVSKEWDEATTAAALETASYITKNLAEVSGVADNAPNREEGLKEFAKRFLERAFRRPLTEEVKRTYIDKQFVATRNFESAIQRIIVLALKSPRFLYREIGRNDSYGVASQLSFGLWDTLPDPELENAANSGNLNTRDQVAAQATRLANDPRAWNKLREFLLLWLKVDEVPDILKNAKQYPGFDAATVSDLRTSLELSLQDTAWSSTADYRNLMLGNSFFLNGRLAKIYGVDLPADAPFQSISLDPDQRSGIVTHPYLLSRFAYLDGSSPIHRGVLIERNLLGRTISPPPANFVPLAASARPDLTTRQRVSLQTKPQFCNNCHGIINPLGFTLERFDAIGRLRDRDNGKPIDASGGYRSRNGKVVQFSGAQDLGKYLANSDDAHLAFVEKLFVHVAKQAPMAFGQRKLTDLQQAFANNQYSIRKLLVDIAVTTALPDEKTVALNQGSKQ